MKTLSQQLIQYARYHRDPRNIATHFIGIPMIVLAVCVLLSRPALGPWASPAVAVAALTTLYYLRLDLRFGLVMGALLGLGLLAGAALAQRETAVWAGSGIGLFVVGWVFQFVGHWWEGRKPAFVDDLVGLVIGPLFVVAEAAFLLGLRPALQAEISAAAGPVRRDPNAALAGSTQA